MCYRIANIVLVSCHMYLQSSKTLRMNVKCSDKINETSIQCSGVKSRFLLPILDVRTARVGALADLDGDDLPHLDLTIGVLQKTQVPANVRLECHTSFLSYLSRLNVGAFTICAQVMTLVLLANI